MADRCPPPGGKAFPLPGCFPAGSPAGPIDSESRRGRDTVSWSMKRLTEEAQPSPALRFLRDLLITLELAENCVFLPCQIRPSGQMVQPAQAVVNRWAIRVVQRRLVQVADGVVKLPEFLR